MSVNSSSIAIQVCPAYIPEHSSEQANRYVFSYTITITNHSDQPAKLLSRKWIITDANGKEVIVEGDGVVGEQPVITNQQPFTYTSGAVLETPVGTMQGHYYMQSEEGDCFLAPIPIFRLAVPNSLH